MPRLTTEAWHDLAPARQEGGMSMADMSRLRRNLAFMRKFPEQHKQNEWMIGSAAIVTAASNGTHPPCGTSLCLAGWDAFLNAPPGSKLVRSKQKRQFTWHAPMVYVVTRRWFRVVSKTPVNEFARDGMQLINGQSEALFGGFRTIDQIEKMADLIEQNPEITAYDLIDQACR